MQHIMKRHDNDLLKKVFLAQRQNPTQGDFVKIVESDLSDLGVTFEQVTSSSTSKEQLKKILKKIARTAAFTMLKEMQSTHKKVKSIKYKAYEMQSYLSSENISHGEAQTLTAFRSQCTRGIKLNFRKPRMSSDLQ